MSVTIKTGLIKYKDPNSGNYVDVDAFGNGTDSAVVAGTQLVIGNTVLTENDLIRLLAMLSDEST